MDQNMKNLVDAVKTLFLKCEEHDRPIVYENKNKVCKFRSGWAKSFSLGWDDVKMGNKCLYCYLKYPGISIHNLHIRENSPPMDTQFLTKKSFNEELIPALESWMAEKVAADEYGGMFGEEFTISMTFDLRSRNDDPPKEPRWYQGHIRVKNEDKFIAMRDAVKNLITSKEYVGAELDSSEYYSCVDEICETAGSFLDELGIDAIKEFYEAMIENAKKSRFDSSMSDVIMGMSAYAYRLLKEHEDLGEEQVDLACFIGLKGMTNATDKYEYEAGTETLKSAAKKGSKLAKDIMKFGNGTIDKAYTYYKDKTLECIANDVTKTVEIKLKDESSEIYDVAVKFLTELLKQGFPTEYEIKCNTKVKNFIDTDLKKSKTNNFFANAATYPEVYDTLKEYARTAFDAYSWYSDASDEQAVSCGGYAAMALALADPVKNFDIGIEFLDNSDFEHAITARYFLQDFSEVCSGENKEKIEEYSEEF